MASPECIAEISKAVGRDLTNDEVDNIERSVDTRAKRKLRENAGMGSEQAYLEAAADFATEAQVTAIIAKRNAMLNMHRTAEAIDFVSKQFADRPGLGLESLMVGTNRLRQGGRMSAMAEQSSLKGYYTRGFLVDVQTLGKEKWDLFVSGAIDREISQELWEIDRAGGKSGVSGSDEARAIAEKMAKWQDMARVDANKAGAWVKKMPGYIVRQSHDMFKLKKAGFEKWRETVLPLLDERTFDDVTDRESFLNGAYDGLSSGVHLAAPGDGLPAGIRHGQSVARAMSQDRLLHFKSADAWFDYNSEFGHGNLRESLLFGLDRTARDTGLMRVWGPNPRETYDRVVSSLMNTKGKPVIRSKFKSDLSWLDYRFAEIDGSAHIPGNVMGAKWAAVVRGGQSVSKLGYAMISGFSDIGLIASELNYQGENFLSGMATALGSLRGKSAAEKEILGGIGIMSDSLRAAAGSRLSGDDSMPGVMSGLLRTFFKWNGLTWWTDSLRDGVALAMSNRLAVNSGVSWSALDGDLKRVMGLFGLDGDKWELLRGVAVQKADGKSFMSPEGARNIPDESIISVLQSKGQKATPASVRRYREEIESQLRAYFVDRVEYAVITPDARTNAILHRGTRPGTALGELDRFAIQFKSFPTAVIQKSLGREIYGRGADTFGQGLKGKNGELYGLAKIIIATSILGYISTATKDILKGKEPRNPLSKATILASMTQGGGLGIYGDYLFGQYSRYGHSPMETGAGPTAGGLTDLFLLAKQAADVPGLLTEENSRKYLAGDALRFTLSNTPFANLFYTKAALDYFIVYQMQEAINPGYLRRMERKMERNNSQKFLVSPSAVYQ